ncbi:conserved hypothetical protein [uncultured Paludibacter sp.]|nr:conserved hypothetical protein [uncultured Paludibacter sp.]
MKRKKKKNDQIKDIIKSARKQSREDEINAHGKPILYQKIETSKKKYKRIKKVDLDENN